MPYNPSGDLDFDRSEFSHHYNRIRSSTPNIHQGNSSPGGPAWSSNSVGWNVGAQQPPQHGSIYAVGPAVVPFSYTEGPAQTPISQKKQQGGQPPTIVSEMSVSGSKKGSQKGEIREVQDPDDVFEGSLKERKIRDVICLGLFVVFLGLMAVVAGYALVTGDLKRLTGDSSDCKNDLRQKTKAQGKVVLPTRIGKLGPGRNSSVLVDEGKFDEDFFDDVARQLEESWPSLVYMSLVAVGLSILVTLLLRLFAGIIVWVVIGIFVAAAAAGTIALWVLYVNAENAPDGDFYEKNQKEFMLTFAIIVSIFTLIFLIVLVAMRKRILLVIQLFKEAGRAVHAIPMLLVQPFWTFLFKVAASAIFIALAVLIETSRVKDDDGYCKRPGIAKISRWLNVFAYYWIMQFLIGCQHLVIAGAVSKWFFTRNKSKLGSPILSSIFNLIRYHLGTIAFGSLIIAIVKFIRYVLNTIKNRLGKASKIAACCLCMCSCCLWCLDKLLQFINRNAYIEVAIYGYGFCPAAKRALKVIVNNALRIAAINSIGDFVLWLGKITIVALSGLCGYYIFRANVPADQKVDVEWVLIVVGMIFAYFVAHCFISTYEMAIDTIFVCFCEDLEMNDGVNKPYYMSKGLMKFVKANQKLEKKQNDKKSK